MALFRRLASTLRGATFWLARRAARERLDVADLVQRYGPGFAALLKLTPAILSPVEQAQVAARAKALTEAGAPEALARCVAALQPLTTAADLVDLAEASSWPLPNEARLYHAAGETFGFDRVREAAGAYSVGDQFERTALRRLIEELLTHQAELTKGLIAFAGSAQAGADAESALDTAASWSALRREKTDLCRRTIDEIEASGGGWTFAKLTIANAALRELAEAVRKR
jgi:glutamate dehydrogenase